MGVYTHAERIIAADVCYDAFEQVKKAFYLLQNVWNRYFEDIDQPDISRYEAEILGIEVLAVTDFLFEALREYHLETGTADSFPGSSRFLELADDYRVYEQISSIDDELLDVIRGLPKERRDAVYERRKSACDLPDDQAIVALKSLLKEVKG